MDGPASWKKKISSTLFRCVLLTLLSALFIQPMFSESLPLRTVSVKIAADHRLKASGKWKIDSRRSLKATSDIFAKESGIEFLIDAYDYWQPDTKQKNNRALLKDLQSQVIPSECDIVLGLIRTKHTPFLKGLPAISTDTSSSIISNLR